MGMQFSCSGSTYNLIKFMDNNNESKDLNIKKKINITDSNNKGPVNFIFGSLTSFILFIVFYKLSSKIAIYFATHRPTNDSEIVQNISASLNTLIIGLSFLATFSFAFIGFGLFIVFIRSFFLENK